MAEVDFVKTEVKAEIVPSNGDAPVMQVAAHESEGLTPTERLLFAISQTADLDRIQKYMDLQDRWEKSDARKQFVAAMSAFKAHEIVVTRDKLNKQFGSKYTSIGNLVGIVTPFLSQHQLSASWDIDQSDPNFIRVVCTIEHVAGHSRSVSVTLPPDVSGSKNPLQEIKSAVTYGKIVTFESICGLASADANLDDDGNGSGKGVGSIEIDKNCKEISEAKTVDSLKFLFRVAYEKAQELNDKIAMGRYAQAKDAAKKRLENAAR